MQVEKYVGLAYKEKGRDFNGVDCWGLVRLYYKNEYQIDLPSFTSEYSQTDVQRIEELIAQYKEGWETIEQPQPGCVVLFRVLGTESHVGITINSEQFLHVRENQDSAIESFASPFWKKRIVGYFKYSENKNAILNAVPHPLRTERYTIPILPGTTLEALVSSLNKEYNVAEELKPKTTIVLNGKVVDPQLWPTTVLKQSDTVEYRAVPTGSTGRMLAMLAVVAIAPELAGYAKVAYMGTAGATIAGSTAVYATAYAATVLVGTALVNAIAPIRPPKDLTQDPGSAERQLMVDGGSNRLTPYGSIPVILGKIRMTALLGSNNFLTYENERDSYVSMLLVWGYGPLEIYEDTLKIGDVPLNQFTDYTIETLNRKTEPSTQQKINFDALYGKDVTPVQIAQELVCEGNPEASVTPGPFSIAAATSDPVDAYTVALHFPQGLRKIVVKGGESGASVATSVTFRIEYSTDSGVTWNLQEVLTVGGDVPKKDGFTTTRTYQFPSRPAKMLVRVRRETGDNTEDNPDLRYYFTSVLQNVTFTRNDTPAIDPLNTKIAKTAFKIKATDQLNGRVDGVSAVVQTWCKTWNGSAWVDGATSNPAALFRYVLEHPANPRRVTNAATQINLTKLQYFHEYCASKGFEFNSVLGASKSVLDVLRDICAAGRASPALIDGKWTVIIDEARVTVDGQPLIIQHFTPHNSWGFEGTKPLPKKPDGLKVTYYDEDNNYQENELIVYDTDKSETNSSLFESITLPGVTKTSLVIDHVKWHMAQIKLRPEVYTLNADVEYLVCNRGDRVKVVHDVPMWGLGSGRVKNRLSSTKIILDEPMPMQAGASYTIRFRSKTGASVTRNVVSKTVDGYYSEIDLLAAVTTNEADAGDLFLFGELNKESQDLIVLSVEPTDNKSARLVLVDYGVTDTYNIFTQYISLSSDTVFESQLTLPPVLQVENFGNSTPLITGFVSDESVMERVSKGVYRYNINVAYVNAPKLPLIADVVEVQYDLLSATDTLNAKSIFVPYQKGSAQIADVKEGETYKVRMRYSGRNGKLGAWSSYSNHTVVGKTNPPSTVTEFTAAADKSSGQILLKWKPNPESDVFSYEVRTQNSGWNSNDTARVFYGDSNQVLVKYTGASSATFYIKAIDSAGNYSVNSAVASFVPNAISNITKIRHTFADTALTSATVTLDWDEITSSEFNIAYYEVTYNSTVRNVKANSITLEADWLGDRIFTIKVVDTNGRKSSGYSEGVSKLAPNSPVNFRAEVIDNTIMFYWSLPERTSLPIDHVILKKGTTWETATAIGEKKGEFTTVNEREPGKFTYWLACVDTEGVESAPAAPLLTSVSEPPDFVFRGERTSTFVSTANSVVTKENATYDGTYLVLPVNTSETWATHFTSRGWSSPQDQLNVLQGGTSKYPLFAQPSGGTGYYQEIFDFGQPLASSRVVLNYIGKVIAGNPTVTVTISLSETGTEYTDYVGVTEVFGNNFQYVKVKIVVSEPSDIGLYAIESLALKLDAKLKNDAGKIAASESDTSGTIVNWNKEFIDVQSITVSASGTTPLNAVYSVKDNRAYGIYSLENNICSIVIPNHGFITGQKVKLFRGSGTAITGIYTITSHTTSSFTVDMVAPNSAYSNESISVYPQSFRVYVFNDSGTQVSANVSWSIKGY